MRAQSSSLASKLSATYSNFDEPDVIPLSKNFSSDQNGEKIISSFGSNRRIPCCPVGSCRARYYLRPYSGKSKSLNHFSSITNESGCRPMSFKFIVDHILDNYHPIKISQSPPNGNVTMT